MATTHNNVYVQFQKMMMIRLFNIVANSFLVLVILFLTSSFYLGNKWTFERDFSENPTGMFIGRTFAGIIVGFLGCVFVLLGNFVLNRTKSDKEKRILRSVIVTGALSVTSSVIGTLAFLFF